jgi:3-hydroxyacyl-CoA dehydrogenase
MEYGDRQLGKQTVLCKDTPAFIANRVGVYLMAKGMELTQEMGLDITEVDKLTGPAIGRPKTGSYRLGDLVGLDVMDKVMKGLKANCPEDQDVQNVELPPFFHYLIENKYLGNKTQQGFYKKTGERDASGRPVILGLNLETHEYEPTKAPKLASLGVAKQIDNLEKRIKAIYKAEDKGGEFIRKSFATMFSYSSLRYPEITDSIYNIDYALTAGFAWELGPFETWDVIGLEQGIKDAEAAGEKVADWVKEMHAAGFTSFYSSQNGVRTCYNPESKSYEALPGAEAFIYLDDYREKAPVFKNDEMTLHDIGDGVLCLEFTSKMNSIGEGILRGIQESIRIAEEDGWKGLVIGNNEQNFSVGANLMLIGMFAFQQQFDELNMAVKLFQDTTMRCRYSSIPVVAATQGYVFGGGCETLMHCDGGAVAAESYIGLVEVGVGLIPGGGGTKEFALRTSDSFFEGDVQMPTLIENFKTIATAAVATSAQEAFNLGYLIKGRDEVVMNAKRNIAEAKQKVLYLADGYVAPIQRKDIKVLGQAGMATLYAAAHSLKLGNYASEHDIKIAKKIAYVLCGGDLSEQTLVSEQYLLDIEREAFLSLAGEQKTLERIQHMLEKNKPLRN